MPYEHPEDNNLKNLHKAMEYNAGGQPIVRTTGGGGFEYTINIANGELDGVTSIEKFGFNVDVDSDKETIWDGGGIYEYLVTAETVAIAAIGGDSAAGTGARTVQIIGLDSTHTEVSDIVTVGGAASTIEFLRIFRAIVITAGSSKINENLIDIRSTGSDILLAQIGLDGTGMNAAGRGQTFMAMFTVPAGKTAYLTQWTVGAGKQNTDAVAMFYVNNNLTVDSAFNAKDIIAVSAATFSKDYAVPLVFTEKSDLEVRAYSTTNNSLVSSTFGLILIDNE